ncbi:G2/M phase-specific E3 ubiquitin-protein ligase-like [Fundulus heteroclitus]|uniref:G2/M phase-specific E3 ubiquitin-protein ligase-like n=1 Tax=Fundulus heteroclitus TaxID=8078 RepID=UPI00165A8C05|nr:G2/M phase-specific E3 ubiquitin-protein ligase-like [Fundulus heteroclitus]
MVLLLSSCSNIVFVSAAQKMIRTYQRMTHSRHQIQQRCMLMLAQEYQLKMCLAVESEDDDDLAVAIYESIQASHTGEVSCGGGSEVQSEDFVIWSNYDDLEREEMAPVTEVAVLVTEEEPELDVTAILKNMSSQLVPGPPPQSNSIMVMRETILDSAFRAFRRQRFSPTHRLDVTFVDCDGTGEGAVDDGGPSREFLRLLVVAIRDSKYFSGPEDSKNLSLVSQGVENGDYTLLGKMVSVALVHGGIRPRFFSSRLYTALGCRPTPPVNLDEVDDYDLKEKLQKILDAETLAETQDEVMEASGALSMLGCTCLILNMDQKRVFIEDVARAYVEGRTKVAKEQFIDGLQTLGVANAIENHHEAIKPIFVGGLKTVSLQDMQKLFSVQLSLPGSNKRRLENQTTIFWNDWLLEVDEGTRPVTLGQILTFASGIDNIPPLGFNTSPTIEFLHHEDGNNRIFPEANTCGVVLRLPIHPTYALFVQYMESGILQSPTFGLI